MARKKTYHSSITGKFVSKEYVDKYPDTTVEVTTCDLKQELMDYTEHLNKVGGVDVGKFDCIEDLIDDYLKDN